jgi:thiol:disulfide interchange protein DsbC
MNLMRTLLLILGLLASYLLFSAHANDAAPETAIEQAVKANFPEFSISHIRESRVAGLYEVLLGSEVVYMSADGRYIFQGSMFDLEERVNLSEAVRALTRIEVLKNIPLSEMIEFAPEKPLYTVYVFTDIDCAYCRRLHKDMVQLNKSGIAVRYLAFPRSGVHSETYNNMVSVWCSANRQQALTEAKLEKPIDRNVCDNPVSEHYLLGQDIGVSGTPAIFTEQGEYIGGYLSPEEMLEALQGS